VSNLRQKDFVPPAWILSLLGAGLFFWLIFKLKELVMLLVVGYALAYVIDPVLCALQKRRVPRSVGVILIFAFLLVLIFVLGLTAFPVISKEYDRLSEEFPSYLEIAKVKFAPFMSQLEAMIPHRFFSASPEGPAVELPKVDPDLMRKVASGLGGFLLGGYSLTLTLLNLVLLPIFVFYLATNFHEFHRNALALFPLIKQQKVRAICLEINQYISAFVRGQLLVCCVLFSLYAVGLGFLGVELWFLLAVITGFGNMVPFVGLITGFVLSSLMALVTFGDFSHMFQVWAVYAVVQSLESTVITPRIVGEKVGLSAIVIILSILAFGSLFGLVGVLLAIPSISILKVLLSHFLRWAQNQ